MTSRVVPKVRIFGDVVRPLQAFLMTEAAGGIVLLVSALVALLWANVHPQSYRAAFDYPLAVGIGDSFARFSLRLFINDGLMAVFFFVVGMEIKRELVTGELRTLRRASLPAVAAVAGMALPAAIYLAITAGGPAQRGWGIPMATDIAFCVGLLTLLKDRVPRPLVVFVTALAIFDDIGGILVIAFFYGSGLHLPWLAAAAGITVVLLLVNRLHVTSGLAYAVLGAALWYALHHGGIHATIAGVILGLMIPARSRRPSREVLRELAAHVAEVSQKAEDEELDGAEILSIEEELEELESPVHRFTHALHPIVAFAIMPVFALANSGVSLHGAGLSSLVAPAALGIAAGLFLGKSIGITLATWVAVRLGLAPMPGGASIGKLVGVAVLSGIGFTVALFIAGLAFDGATELLDQAKVGILFGSLAAGLVGYLVLRAGRQVAVER
jgi:Na+:H+ antiporter, NhaA family